MPNGFLSGFSANDQYISNLEYSRFMSESLGIFDEHDFPLDIKQIQKVDDVLAKINRHRFHLKEQNPMPKNRALLLKYYSRIVL